MALEVSLVLGCPASGKTTHTKQLIERGLTNLNRDTEGGKIVDLLPKMEALLKDNKSVVLDNLFPTAEVRKSFLDLAKKYGATVNGLWVKTSIEDATFNFVQRAIGLLGAFPEPELVKKSKHPNIFPPTVLFKYKKDFQKPTKEEGFDDVIEIPFVRKDNPAFTNKALILDYDGCLRQCIGGNEKFPVAKEQIQINPKCKDVLLSYRDKGYKLLGVSNQSGVSKGELTLDGAKELFNYTNQQLGLDIEYRFCPHQSAPISCYCRKPQIGIGVEFIIKHQLNRKECIMIGDMTTDKTFATRCGFQYIDQADFYK